MIPDLARRPLVLDIDGVLRHGRRGAPGLERFLAAIDGRPWVCLTNNSMHSAHACSVQLAELGASVPEDRIVSVTDVATDFLRRAWPDGGAALVIGTADFRAAVRAAGLEVVASRADVVVLGLDLDLAVRGLGPALQALRGGARLVAANADPLLVTEAGLLPGTGMLLAALRAASSVEPELLGKPSRLIFDVALRRLGAAGPEVVVVGDSLSSDIAGGRAVGAATVLVQNGVTTANAVLNPRPDLIVSGLEALTDLLAGGPS
jgi:4-nitrophenyl phosphatase